MSDELKPVAKIVSADEYGPRLEWTTHWVDLIGKTLCVVDTHPPTGDAAGKEARLTAEDESRILKAMRDADMAADYTGLNVSRDGRYLGMYRAAIASLTKTADGEIQS